MQDAAQRSAEILAKHKLVDVRGAADSVTLTHYQFAGREGRPRTVREQAFQVSACERLMARMGLSATDCPAGLFAVRTLPDNGVVYREADLLVSAQWVDEKGEGESRLDVVCLGARHSVSATVSHSGERVFFELPFPLVRVPYNETVATVDGTPLDASKVRLSGVTLPTDHRRAICADAV